MGEWRQEALLMTQSAVTELCHRIVGSTNLSGVCPLPEPVPQLPILSLCWGLVTVASRSAVQGWEPATVPGQLRGAWEGHGHSHHSYSWCVGVHVPCLCGQVMPV